MEFSFNISGIDVGETIISVHLRLKFAPVFVKEGPFEVIISNKCSDSYSAFEKEINIPVSIDKLVVVDNDIDITTLIKNLKVKENVCLKVKVITAARGLKKNKPKDIVGPLLQKHVPILLVYSQDNGKMPFNLDILIPHHMKKRDISDRNEDNPQKNLKELRNQPCQRIPYYINFKKDNVNKKIIAPEGYHANYCYGSCLFPISERVNNTLHAQVQSLMNRLQGDIPEPCCSPIKYSPFSVLFYTESRNIVLKHHSNMVVRECGCI